MKKPSLLNKVIKALNDPTRREILALLRKKDLSAGEIAEYFQLGKPTISHHLDILKQAELISSEKEGHYIYYSLNTSVLDELLQWIVKIKGQNK